MTLPFDGVARDPYVQALAGTFGEDVERVVTESILDEFARGVLVIIAVGSWHVQLSKVVPFGEIRIVDVPVG